MATDDPLIQRNTPTHPGWWWGRARSGLAWRPWDVVIAHDGERFGLCVRLQDEGERPRYVPFRDVVSEWGSELVGPTEPTSAPRDDRDATARSHAVQQAQVWAQEARTQRAIVAGMLDALGIRCPDYEAEAHVRQWVSEHAPFDRAAAPPGEVLQLLRGLDRAYVERVVRQDDEWPQIDHGVLVVLLRAIDAALAVEPAPFDRASIEAEARAQVERHLRECLDVAIDSEKLALRLIERLRAALQRIVNGVDDGVMCTSWDAAECRAIARDALAAGPTATPKCSDCRHYWERRGRCTKAIDPEDPREGGPGRPWGEPDTCAPPWCPGFEARAAHAGTTDGIEDPP